MSDTESEVSVEERQDAKEEPVVTKAEKEERSALKERIARKNNVEKRRQAAHRQECREVFDLFDTNGNGSLDYKEFEVALRVLGVAQTPVQLKRLIASVDQDGNGCIAWTEFQTLMLPIIQNRDRVKMIEEGFHLFDTRGPTVDGLPRKDFKAITLANLRGVAEELGEEITEVELKEMLEFLDAKAQPDDDVIDDPSEMDGFQPWVDFQPELTKTEFVRILDEAPIF
mmetsp:Transcript_68046/g.215250  ORF Transcript_68046/g.215250 Transcript_68046/m.215250 type:complete len:227 (+) Transcript_68046:136-816(+)